MRRKQGFTLIELLAVIVILAIIALIATPIILNIVEKARKSAFQDSAYGLIEAAKLQYVEGILDGTSGATEYDFDSSTTGANLNFSGSAPEGGRIVVDANGNVAIAIHASGLCALKGTKESTVKVIDYDATTCIITETIEVEKTYTLGEEVTFDPGDGVSTTWNVLSDNGSTVTMMLNQNLGGTVAWQSSSYNADGPVTALEALNDRTLTWTNVPVISSYEYINNAGGTTHAYGYQKLRIVAGKAYVTNQSGTESKISSTEDESGKGTLRARLITGQEVATIIGDTLWNQTKYTGNTYAQDWMKNNIDGDNGTSLSIGYWTLSAIGHDYSGVWFVNYLGDIQNYSSNNFTGFGIRPVIEIPKSKLS